jgi:hypothetical protein
MMGPQDQVRARREFVARSDVDCLLRVTGRFVPFFCLFDQPLLAISARKRVDDDVRAL